MCNEIFLFKYDIKLIIICENINVKYKKYFIILN